jgi:hypothetical protein
MKPIACVAPFSSTANANVGSFPTVHLIQQPMRFSRARARAVRSILLPRGPRHSPADFDCASKGSVRFTVWILNGSRTSGSRLLPRQSDILGAVRPEQSGFAASMLFESLARHSLQHLRLIPKAACPSLFVFEVLLFPRHILTIPHPSAHRPCARSPRAAPQSRPPRPGHPSSPISRLSPHPQDCSPRS